MNADAVAAEPKPSKAAATFEALSGFVREALRHAGTEGVLAVTVPAPVARVEAPLRALRRGPCWVFAGEGPHVSALGVAKVARPRGEGRFEQARAACDEMLGAVVNVVHEDAFALPLRVFAGFSFAPGTADAAPWEPFGDGLVTLPRWTYAVEHGRAGLTLAVDLRDGVDERLVLCEFEAVFAAIEEASRVGTASGRAPSVVRTEPLERARWNRAVEALRAAIERRDLSKVVVARRTVLTTTHDIEALEVLGRLDEARSHSTRFLVRAGSASFVGASPEHLFLLRGTKLSTEALAGSIAADAEGGVERLLSSAKDREEHRLVVTHLLERLAPLCTRIDAPDSPQVRRLPTVVHLRTPIDAELDQRRHPMEVLAALHPTPAVGGVPTARAVPWILAHEAAPRGWYSAPLGWIDARGDAEFVVALRCGLVQGGRAWLWAGAGIVAGSEAATEWDETALKLRPMLRALGAST